MDEDDKSSPDQPTSALAADESATGQTESRPGRARPPRKLGGKFRLLTYLLWEAFLGPAMCAGYFLGQFIRKGIPADGDPAFLWGVHIMAIVLGGGGFLISLGGKRGFLDLRPVYWGILVPGCYVVGLIGGLLT